MYVELHEVPEVLERPVAAAVVEVAHERAAVVRREDRVRVADLDAPLGVAGVLGVDPRRRWPGRSGGTCPRGNFTSSPSTSAPASVSVSIASGSPRKMIPTSSRIVSALCSMSAQALLVEDLVRLERCGSGTARRARAPPRRAGACRAARPPPGRPRPPSSGPPRARLRAVGHRAASDRFGDMMRRRFGGRDEDVLRRPLAVARRRRPRRGRQLDHLASEIRRMARSRAGTPSRRRSAPGTAARPRSRSSRRSARRARSRAAPRRRAARSARPCPAAFPAAPTRSSGASGTSPRTSAWSGSIWLPNAPASLTRSTVSTPRWSIRSLAPAYSAAFASWIARTSFWVIEQPRRRRPDLAVAEVRARAALVEHVRERPAVRDDARRARRRGARRSCRRR